MLSEALDMSEMLDGVLETLHRGVLDALLIGIMDALLDEISRCN